MKRMARIFTDTTAAPLHHHFSGLYPLPRATADEMSWSLQSADALPSLPWPQISAHSSRFHRKTMKRSSIFVLFATLVNVSSSGSSSPFNASDSTPSTRNCSAQEITVMRKLTLEWRRTPRALTSPPSTSTRST
ncbi:hypothetical protein GQ600_20419 [Phytophthora cactorum]|nr:hypothetical protein GQ600_20419 [Phytophthora cactorum]